MSYGGRLGYMKFRQTAAALREVIAQSSAGLPRRVRVAIESCTVATPLSRVTAVVRVREDGVDRLVVVRVVNCKVYIAVDVETHMVLAATVTDDYVHDVTQFATLLGMIPRRFSIAEVYADKGYYSIENYGLVEDRYGAVPFIDFKDSAKPVGGGPHDRALERYRAKHEAQDDSKPRAAVECVNSMFLRTQKPFVRAKLAQQRECEVLAMMGYHNICRSVVLHRTAGLEIPYADERAMAVTRRGGRGRVSVRRVVTARRRGRGPPVRKARAAWP